MGKDAPVIDRVLRSHWWKGKGPNPDEKKGKDATKVLHEIRKEIAGRLTPGLEADSSSSEEDEPDEVKAKAKAKKEGFFTAFFKKKGAEGEDDEVVAGTCLDKSGTSGKGVRAKSFLAATMQRDGGVLSGPTNADSGCGRGGVANTTNSTQDWPGPLTTSGHGPGISSSRAAGAQTPTNDLVLPRLRSTTPSQGPTTPVHVPRVNRLRASVDVSSSPLHYGSGSGSPAGPSSPFTSRQSSGPLTGSNCPAGRSRPDHLVPSMMLPSLASEGSNTEPGLGTFERQCTRDDQLLSPGSVDKLGHAAFLFAVPSHSPHPAAPSHLMSSPLGSGNFALSGSHGLSALGMNSTPGASSGLAFGRASTSQHLSGARVEPMAPGARTASVTGLGALSNQELFMPHSPSKHAPLASICGGADFITAQELDLDDTQSVTSTTCSSNPKGRGPRPRNLIATALAPTAPAPFRRRSVVCVAPSELEPASSETAMLSPMPPAKPAAHGRRRPVGRHETAPQLQLLFRASTTAPGEHSPRSPMSSVSASVQSLLSPTLSGVGLGGATAAPDVLPPTTPFGAAVSTGNGMLRGAAAGVGQRDGVCAADVGTSVDLGEAGTGGPSRVDEKIKQLWQVQDKTAAEVARLAALEEKQRREESIAPTPKWTNGKTAYRNKNVTREIGGSLGVNTLSEYDQPRFKGSRTGGGGTNLLSINLASDGTCPW